MTKRDEAPPRFKMWRPPKKEGAPKAPATGPVRTSPRSRGYDAKWDRISLAFRAKNPWCAECERRGLFGATDLVDHIIPVQDRPDLRHEWSNLQALCKPHHDAWKLPLENYARRTGQIGKLPLWCSDPAARPDGYRLDFMVGLDGARPKPRRS